jgi:hypothetical protein
MYARPVSIAQVCALSIYLILVSAAGGQPLPPNVAKTVLPNPVVLDDYGRLNITLSNPNGGNIYAAVNDAIPACMQIANPVDIVWTPPNCFTSYTPKPGSFGFAVANLASDASCQASVLIRSVSAQSCPNTTYAPYTIGPDNQPLTGTPASATWTINAPPTLTFTGPGANLSSSANLGGMAVADGDSIQFGGATPTTVTYDITNALQQLVFTANSYTINAGGPSYVLNAAGILLNVAGGTGVTAVVHVPSVLMNDTTFEADTGRLFYTSPINMNGKNLLLTGGGGVTLNGGLSGSGTIGIDTVGSVIVLGTIAPTVAFDDVQGELNPFGTFTGPVYIHGTGLFVAEGGPFGNITVFGHGSTRSVGSMPGNLSVNQLTYNYGYHTIDIAATPGVYSKVTSTGPIEFKNTVLRLVENALPNPGDVYSDVFSSTAGTVSQCPVDVYCDNSKVFAHAVCTSTTVSVVVDANDGIFRASNDSCDSSLATCQYQCTTGVCEP